MANNQFLNGSETMSTTEAIKFLFRVTAAVAGGIPMAVRLTATGLKAGLEKIDVDGVKKLQDAGFVDLLWGDSQLHNELVQWVNAKILELGLSTARLKELAKLAVNSTTSKEEAHRKYYELLLEEIAKEQSQK